MTFGEVLNQHLIRNDRTAAWLADRLDLYPSTVTRWLNEESRPCDLEMVVRIADVLHVRASEERKALIESAGFAYFEAPAQTPEPTVSESPPPEPITRSAETSSTRPDPPPFLARLGLQDILTHLGKWFRWHEAPADARVSWAGMTLYLLAQLTSALPIHRIQSLLIALALWLVTASLLMPMLQWPLDDGPELGQAAWYLTLASLLIPPLMALVTRPDGIEHFLPQNLHQSAVLWFLKLAGAYAGFGGFVGIVLGLTLLVYQVGGSVPGDNFCRVISLLPLLFCHVGARRIPYERFRLYGEIRTHPADRLLWPVYIGFGPLLAFFIYLANGQLKNPWVGFAVLVGLILLIWWERRSAR